jgi:G3E family GTPase
MKSIMNTKPQRIPVTVITGFLGSGKTTLLNRILTENHGKRIAVIENEFGEVGIDHQLVIQSDEEIFEMNNGCICCTVRGDLIRILSKLRQRRDRFDSIIIETTGLADPAPVAQTFFVDQEIKDDFSLDGIVTVVDSKHIWQHIDESDEALKQIGFADVILLNKTDLIRADQLDSLENKIKSINAAGKIHRTQNAHIDMGLILNQGGFDLDRALAVEPQFLEPERPFEWSGSFSFQRGDYKWLANEGPDPAMSLCLIPANDPQSANGKELEEIAQELFSTSPKSLTHGESIQKTNQLYQIDLQRKESKYLLSIQTEGNYTLFTEHHPDEFQMKLLHEGSEVLPISARAYKAYHEHDDQVSSVGIRIEGSFNGQKLNLFIKTLLNEKGADIYRMKGVVSLIGENQKIIFQAVHMLFEAQPGESWGDQPRENSIIFIGRQLDRKSLTEGIYSCLE